MKQFILLSILYLGFQSAFAGSISVRPVHSIKPFPPGISGRITGTVVDSTTKQGVEFATVSVFPDGNPKPIDGTSTDSKGQFKLINLAEGKYTISISFLGYRTKFRSNIVISSAKESASLGIIYLRDNSIHLKGAVVTAQRALIENKIDKMVFNAEQDISSQSGVATDVLRKVPQVAVDVDGNVELRGSTNVRVLINGKPSTILATSLADALQSIPANQIKSIEVITNPSAKYDAEGTAGIINIIMKKSTAKGVSGNVNVTGGSRFENGSFNLNARKGTFGVNAGISGNMVVPRLSTTSSLKKNNTGIDTANYQVAENGQSKVRRNGYNWHFGIDWDLSEKDNLTSTVSLNNFGFDNFGPTNQYSAYGPMFTGKHHGPDTLKRYISNQFRVKGIDWSTDYKRIFNDRGREFDASYQISSSNNLANYEQNQLAPVLPVYGRRAYNTGTTREQNIQLDYTEPISKTTKLEVGVKAVLRDISSNSTTDTLQAPHNFVYSPLLSDKFDYKQNILAAYAVLSFKLFNYLDFYTGLRIEHTRNHGLSADTALNFPSYNSYVPSVTVARTISPTQTIKVAYTQRIQRPGLRDLNPFINAGDPTAISTGNPNLGPEHTQSLELSYNVFLGKGSSINTAVYDRYTTNDIQSYTALYAAYPLADPIYRNVQVSMNENIGRQNLYGINIFGSVPITPKFTVRGNVNLFEDHEQNIQVASQSFTSFNYRLNANASYNFTPTLSAEFFGFANSPRRTVQGSSPSFSIYNLGIRQQLWHKKGSIAFTASAPFSKYHDFHSSISGTGFSAVTDRNVPLRSFGLNFAYNFGKINYTSPTGKYQNSKPNENDVHEDDNSGGLGGGGGGGASGGGSAPGSGQRPGGEPSGAPATGGKGGYPGRPGIKLHADSTGRRDSGLAPGIRQTAPSDSTHTMSAPVQPGTINPADPGKVPAQPAAAVPTIPAATPGPVTAPATPADSTTAPKPAKVQPARLRKSRSDGMVIMSA